MFKKLMMSAAAVAVALPLQTVSAFAKQDCSKRNCIQQNYVDENNDGICDNQGTCNSKGANFIDANNDGICDNYRESQGHRHRHEHKQ